MAWSAFHSTQEYYTFTHAVYALVFSLKAKLCLHVVKHALNNYINVAMIWIAIQVGLPFWLFIFCTHWAACGRMPVTVRYTCTLFGVRVCGCLMLWQTSTLWSKGKKICTPSASGKWVLRLLSVTCNLCFHAKNKQRRHPHHQIWHITLHSPFNPIT